MAGRRSGHRKPSNASKRSTGSATEPKPRGRPADPDVAARVKAVELLIERGHGRGEAATLVAIEDAIAVPHRRDQLLRLAIDDSPPRVAASETLRHRARAGKGASTRLEVGAIARPTAIERAAQRAEHRAAGGVPVAQPPELPRRGPCAVCNADAEVLRLTARMTERTLLATPDGRSANPVHARAWCAAHRHLAYEDLPKVPVTFGAPTSHTICEVHPPWASIRACADIDGEGPAIEAVTALLVNGSWYVAHAWVRPYTRETFPTVHFQFEGLSFAREALRQLISLPGSFRQELERKPDGFVAVQATAFGTHDPTPLMESPDPHAFRPPRL